MSRYSAFCIGSSKYRIPGLTVRARARQTSLTALKKVGKLASRRRCAVLCGPRRSRPHVNSNPADDAWIYQLYITSTKSCLINVAFDSERYTVSINYLCYLSAYSNWLFVNLKTTY